jgi:hypothetical protein
MRLREDTGRQLHRRLRVRLIVDDREMHLPAPNAAARVRRRFERLERLLDLFPEKTRAAGEREHGIDRERLRLRERGRGRPR